MKAPRSWLFVPADSERKIAKALDSAADAIIFDLEDSVAPAQKAAARESQSRPNAGIVTWAHRSFNQKGELVCECTRTALLLKKPR